MEKYSKHLESIVAERTQDLLQEKQKTDRLLYSKSGQSCDRNSFMQNYERYNYCPCDYCHLAVKWKAYTKGWTRLEEVHHVKTTPPKQKERSVK